MNTIKVIAVSSEHGKLRVEYEISPLLEKYFTTERVFEVEYSEGISAAPASVLVIPFVCNALPIVWLADAVLEVPQLDCEFYEGIPDILKGYTDMYPMLDFKGEVRVARLVDNRYEPTADVAAFFSGGVDAFATLIAHAEEKPQLITLWGADVRLNDTEGWARVKQHVNNTCREFALPVPMFVRSNFRHVVNEANLEELIANSGDTWWHGFQHGIALIGHAAPLAVSKRLRMVYIASSYTPDSKATCASDPTIDNNVRLASSRVWHDQYECTRQQKVQHIVEYCCASGRTVMLRVCWISTGGANCKMCEKCIRTIFAILAELGDPEKFGFKGWQQHSKLSQIEVRETLAKAKILCPIWQDIKDRFCETQAYRNDDRVNWIYSLNVNQPLTWKMRVKHGYPLARRALRFLKRKLQNN